jgi:hypothetical protein
VPGNCVALPAVTADHIAEFHDLPLQPHPTCEPGPLRSLSVSGALDATGRITVDCLLQGELLGLRLPGAARAPQRRDELWRHTCVELFARRGAAEAYVEFNFSPSGDWAVYRFEGYRRGQSRPQLAPPGITLHALGPGQLRLQARAQLPLEADPAERLATAATGPGVWQLGFAAVIEASDGTLAYWATRHAGARPDFHAPESFSLALMASGDAPRNRAAGP